jgi:tetratricopeptide (TPR) repeat protein
MGKFFVPSEARTPADQVREALDKAGLLVVNLRGAGGQVLKLLHLLDQTAKALAELEEAGADVRAERARFETIQRQLGSRQRRFLAEAGAAFHEERAAVQPDRAHSWWFLDEAVAQEQKQRLRRVLTWSLVGVILLVAAWLVYARFFAPLPQDEHRAAGEFLILEGDLRAALAEFEAATLLAPDDPETWLWQGVIHVELDELDEAETAFDTARSLYETDFDFLLSRGLVYLRLGTATPATSPPREYSRGGVLSQWSSRGGNLDAASADVEQAILENPDSGKSYYVRASIAVEQGDYNAAIADLERASELAHAAGDVQLEAAARTRLAMIMQRRVLPGPTLTP